MRGDIPAVAFRLACALPARTHEWTPPAYMERDSANNVKACVINGVRYESLTEAARQLKCARETIRLAIRKGTGIVERHGKRGGSNARALFIGNERFGSMAEAKAALGCSLKTLHKMLDDGRARYAGKHE